MSTNSQGENGSDQTSDLADALYFDSGDHRLFGWLHRPSAQNSRGIGLVICQPFGYEAICAHIGIRAFAEASAAIGVPALRFDYSGTGDSADIHPQANQLDLWSKDILAAIGELQRLTGVERVCLLGIRLGASLATMAATQCTAVGGLILISPIITGRRYLRDLRTARLAASIGADTASASAPNDGSMEASGFLLSAASLASLTQVDLSPAKALSAETLIIDGSSMPVARKWAEDLSAAGTSTRYLALPGLIEMVMAMPHDAEAPDAMVKAACDWLIRLSGASPPLAKFTSAPSRAGESIAPATVMELPGDGPIPGTVLTERPVFLESNPPVFGILTEPRHGETRRRAVILLNAGATYHVGPNRAYVSLARRWARCGYLVLRMDLTGVGDSATRREEAHNAVFPPGALEDIRAAIEFVRARHGIDDVTLCGFCSGAYHSLRAAAAAMPVNRILMVNLENFHWTQGADLHGVEPAEVFKRTREHRQRIFSSAAWAKLLTGKVDIGRILSIYLRRPLLATESVVRDWARRIRVRLPRDVGWELEDIAARGVRVVFAFARGEAGIDLLRIEGGSSIKRLGERCRIHIIDGADHVFSQSGSRAVLERILSDELFAQNRNREIPPTSRPALATNPMPAPAPTAAGSNRNGLH